MSIEEPYKFSFEDFEKGLMLAGLVSPANVNELEEREVLDEFERQSKKDKGKIYFRRAVLAAKIASELSAEPTFGRIKFQKLVYLCEHAASMKLQERYAKQAAGPFDNKFMHSIEQEFKKQNWFLVEKVKDGDFTRSKYKPLSGVNGYAKYYDSYFSEHSDYIDHIIRLFRKEKTDKAEIAATLFACALELKDSNDEVTEGRLLEFFYNWSERKGQYSQPFVLSVWHWMIDNAIVDL